MHNKLLVYIIIIMASLLTGAHAEPLTGLPDGVSPGLDYLLELPDGEQTPAVKLDMAVRILDFMDQSKALENPFSVDERDGAASDFFEFTVNHPWPDVVDLVYSPSIPSYLTMPSSIRRSHWIEVDGQQQPFPKLPTQPEELKTPVLIKGVEFIENSPDTNSGAYYAYNLERALLLFMHKGRRVLISISVQQDKSDVGKKGMVLGSDDEWNYLYTGEKGCSLRGLGWVDTFMYDSESIMVYYESDMPDKRVKCATFKWLNAGWSGINFVQGKHIRRGVERFARDFKTIIESPALPDNNTLAAMFQKIDELPTDVLRTKSIVYFDHLRDYYGSSKPKYNKWISELLDDDTYLENMSRQEMQALVSIEYLKFIIGKPNRFGTEYFADLDGKKKPS